MSEDTEIQVSEAFLVNHITQRKSQFLQMCHSTLTVRDVYKYATPSFIFYDTTRGAAQFHNDIYLKLGREFKRVNKV